MGLWLLMTALATRLTVILLVVGAVVSVTLPNQQCPNKCGDIDIPYPFGIREGCYYKSTPNDSYYAINCNGTYSPSRPFYGNVEIFDISLLEGKMRISSFISNRCYDKYDSETDHTTTASLKLGRFLVSPADNVFAATGCDAVGLFTGTRNNRAYTTGCLTTCNSQVDVEVNGTCSGSGCCQTTIPGGVTEISSMEVVSLFNHTNLSSFNPCNSAFVVAKDLLETFSLANLTTDQPPNKLPVVLDWMIGTEKCATARSNDNLLCKANTICDDTQTIYGYRCNCSEGFSGNPYSPDGCQDIDECADPTLNDCEKPASCKNTPGSYACQCPKGYHRSGDNSGHRCEPNKKTEAMLFVVIGVCCSIITLIVLAVWLYLGLQKKQLQKERENFFRQNGGDLLHQKLSDGEDVSVEMVKIFTNEDLDKATNKYINVVGKGGFGMVYKGVLANKQVVAIKRSLKVDPKQSDQFINEVILLSKLNHRNVVKLIGCCLETEVPLLVYEFINNGTLYHHLHDDGKSSLLTWSIRLKIASEVANVLSYLHTAIFMPIIHRDMKSSNILLDTNYTAKVSDFGDSRLVPTDQDYLSTAILGTRGYLDPEYIQTNELTSKSDVYSFGVVLTELLTGQEALSYERPKSDVCLAFLFIRKWKEGGLTEILDDKISRDYGVMEQVIEVANIAHKCLKHKSDERPTMEEVAMELHKIRKMAGSLSWPKSSGMVLQEDHSTAVDIEMCCSKGNITESSNDSQVVDHFAGPFESGR